MAWPKIKIKKINCCPGCGNKNVPPASFKIAPNWKTIQMQMMIYLHNGKLLSNVKEQTIASSNDVLESEKHYAKRKKLNTKVPTV